MADAELVQCAQQALDLADTQAEGWQQAARACYALANAEAVRSNDPYLGLAAAFLHDTLTSPDAGTIVEALEGMDRALTRSRRSHPAVR